MGLDIEKRKKYLKLYYENNKKRLRVQRREYFRQYAQTHKEQIELARLKNIDSDKASKKKYRLKNKELLNEKERQRYRANIKHVMEKHRQWEINHPDYDNEYNKKRRQTDSNFKLRMALRSNVYGALKRKQNKYITKTSDTFTLLGCDIVMFKQHLQQTAILNGYFEFDINNYSGRDYHIDHIIPCSAWNLSCAYHQKLCFHYSNLQILSAKENLMKFTKMAA